MKNLTSKIASILTVLLLCPVMLAGFSWWFIRAAWLFGQDKAGDLFGQ